MDQNWNNFFRHTFTFLKVGGMWRPEENCSGLKYILWWMYNFYVISYSVGMAISQSGALLETYKDTNNLIKNLNMAILLFVTLIKIYVWYRNRDEIIQLIKLLTEKMSVYKTFEIFNPDEIINEESKSKRILDYIYMVAGLMVVALGSMACLGTLYKNMDKYKIFVDSYNISHVEYTDPLPYFAVVPWDYKESVMGYVAAVLFLWFGVSKYSFIVVGFDTVFTTLALYSTAHLKVLMEALRTIRVRSYRRMNASYVPKLYDSNKEIHGIMDEEMNACIVHLQTIFRMCERIEDIFNFVALLQLLQSVIVLCTSLYLVSEVPITSGRFIAELMYLLGIIWQVFQYSWYGNKLTLTCLATSDALFEGDWLNSSPTFKKKMLFSMCRLGKPVIFTAGKFVQLTLPTFVSIMRLSYSVYAILKNDSGGS